MRRFILSWLLLTALLASTSLGATEEPTASVTKPHLVIVMAEGEYKTDQTLPPFAKANLEPDFRVTLLFANKNDRNDIPGLEAIKTADVVLLSIRRRVLPPDQLALVRAYVQQGKPLVAIRTSCHAFCLRNEHPPAGLAEWPDFDQQILGCHYVNHYGEEITSYVQVAEKARNHPILQGVRSSEWRVFSSLYQVLPLAESATLLMTGRAEANTPHEPVAWTNRPKSGNRVFFTSLGHPQDFTLPDFVRLLRNGVYWAADLPIPTRGVVTVENAPQK
jgi:type 1 glutamine amidotransferase